jgi:hypothetical protein
MARPTKYKEEYATEEYRNQFIEYCKGEDVNETVTLCGLAVYIGVCEDTLQEWCKVHPAFSVSTRIIKQISKNQMMQGGLKGKLNPAIVRLGLSANHGMSEKNITEHEGGINVIIGK